MELRQVSSTEFLAILEMKQRFVPRIKQSTTPACDIASWASLSDYKFYLTKDNQSGFAINGACDSGEFCSLFSDVKGRGKALVTEAIKLGAEYLDCFDGYLVDFYKSCGFIEINREQNWSKGGPDVVFMSL